MIMSIAPVASAADNPKLALLKQLNQIQIITYDTTINFLNYTSEDNKTPYNTTQYYADNKTASAEGSKLAAEIDTTLSSLAIKTTSPMTQLWTAYDHILNNEQLPLVAPGGVIDTFNCQELVKARNALIAELDTVRKVAESDVPALDIMALSQARKVKEIAMTYTARSSPTQGTYMAIDSKFDIKQESQKVSTIFDDLLTQAAQNPAQLKLIADAKTDWMFILPVLSSDRKIQAASIVSIYSATIVKLLGQL